MFGPCEPFGAGPGEQRCECRVEVAAEVPVAGVVEAVDASVGVDGEEGGVGAVGAEGADSGAECAAEVGERTGGVEGVQGVDAQAAGGDLASWAGGVDGQVAEFGPDFDGGGADGVLVSAG